MFIIPLSLSDLSNLLVVSGVVVCFTGVAPGHLARVGLLLYYQKHLVPMNLEIQFLFQK